MSIKRRFTGLANAALKHFGAEIISSDALYEWQRNANASASVRQGTLPEGVAQYLVQNNPLLKDLQARYSEFNGAVTEPLVWMEGYLTSEEMLYFRGDNAYVWQLRGQNMNPFGYILATYYVHSIDKLGLLDSLGEDNYFGNYALEVGNRTVSRDLLDSILEIYFLERHLDISTQKKLTILDVGAGYGRLAHRMLGAFPNISRYLCADAFPTSTFICDYYLRFRGLQESAKSVPLDLIEHELQRQEVTLALNIHSFSECRISAIDWWVSLFAKNRISHLFIVPNKLELLTNDGTDFSGVFRKYGYTLVARAPKFTDPSVQKYGINPSSYFLFELC